jgi:hypothetical protein
MYARKEFKLVEKERQVAASIHTAKEKVERCERRAGQAVTEGMRTLRVKNPLPPLPFSFLGGI